MLHLPSMPELRAAKASKGFVPSEVDADDIKYLDKPREKARLQRLRKQEAINRERLERGLPAVGVRQPKKKKMDAWSQQKDRKDNKLKRKAKKEAAAALKAQREAEDIVAMGECKSALQRVFPGPAPCQATTAARDLAGRLSFRRSQPAALNGSLALSRSCALAWPAAAEEAGEEWDDLAKEARLMKKLKRGKISEREFQAGVADETEMFADL